MQDPRFKNKVFSGKNLEGFALSYCQSLGDAFKAIELKNLEQAYQLIIEAQQQNKHIYAIGNGGSAAIADHLCCDWTKGTAEKDFPHIKTQSLVSNVPIMTAIANDFGYELIFAQQIDFLAEQGDILFAISSSGNSPNIIKAVEMAKLKKMRVIGLTGFSGGQVKKIADISLHVPIDNYGVVEDIHQMLMHILAQYIAKRQSSSF